MSDWLDLIRDVPDFPKPGVRFKDITPMLADADAFAAALEALADPWRGVALDAVVGVESRGFILGAGVARILGTGFVPIRKPGRLPAQTLGLDYGLEYGRDRVEIHADALERGARVILLDDILATGGTLKASLNLLRRQGANVIGVSVLLELLDLRAREHWGDPAPLLAAAAV